MRHLNESIRLTESIDKEAGLLKLLKDAYLTGIGLTPSILCTIIENPKEPQHEAWEYYCDLRSIDNDEILKAQDILAKNLGCTTTNLKPEDVDNALELCTIADGEPYVAMKDMTASNAEYVSVIAKTVKDPSFLKAKCVGFGTSGNDTAIIYWSKTPWGEKAIKLINVDNF